MQNVSQAYKESIRDPSRLMNRGYIKVYIGVINQKAQNSVGAKDERNNFTYFSNTHKPFNGFAIEELYATCENNFTKVDGSMRFLPQNEIDVKYNNGLITEEISGTIYISFGDLKGFDIKGLTIDFGECYPINFLIENDSGTHYFTDNNKAYWTTEDVFYGISYLKIIPTKMRYGMNRLRIYQFTCGITNIFTNKEVQNYSLKDYVSSIAETIPSQDMSITVDNQNLYYSVDNPDSALSFMEIGQEVRTSFGYDVTGNGDIEWLQPNTCYLKSWSANDKQAKFTATDRFDYLTGTYYKGYYRESGISLYDLAIDVITNAGMADEREYFVDPYLKKIIVYNPIPVVKHSEALQIIANAGRCVLYEDRQSRIHIQSSFVPDMEISVNNQTEYSHIENILKDDLKDGYAEYSKDFTTVNGSLFFMPQNNDYFNTGYISKSISNENGLFEENPKITINLETGFVPFGLIIRFKNIAPAEFKMTTYYDGAKVLNKVLENLELTYVVHEQFEMFDKIEIEFIKNTPHSRIFVDNILIGDVTDYTFDYKHLVSATPTGTRQQKIKSIKMLKTLYRKSKEEKKEISQEEITISPNNLEYVVYFTNSSYDLSVSVQDNPSVSCYITDQSNYFAKLMFSGITKETIVKYVITGYEFVIEENFLTVPHNENGEEKEWKNPLVSTNEHAKELEEWVASYYLGDIDYQFKYRGDPSVDANDLFYLGLRDRSKSMVRGYENTLTYNGGWSATMKARKVVL